MAVVIQPYVLSSSSFRGGSEILSDGTVVSGLSVTMTRCNYSGSAALSRTIGQSIIMRPALSYVHTYMMFYLGFFLNCPLQVTAVPESQQLALTYAV